MTTQKPVAIPSPPFFKSFLLCWHLQETTDRGFWDYVVEFHNLWPVKSIIKVTNAKLLLTWWTGLVSLVLHMELMVWLQYLMQNLEALLLEHQHKTTGLGIYFFQITPTPKLFIAFIILKLTINLESIIFQTSNITVINLNNILLQEAEVCHKCASNWKWQPHLRCWCWISRICSWLKDLQTIGCKEDCRIWSRLFYCWRYYCISYLKVFDETIPYPQCSPRQFQVTV